MFNKKILSVAVLSAAVFAAGCSDSGSSSPSLASGDDGGTPGDAPATTAFTVDVQAPDSLQTVAALTLPQQLKNFFIAPAYAVDGSDLDAGNFAVTVVDTAGNVVEIVELTEDNISQNPDGTWEISVPGNPRLDCIIVADINGPLELTVGSPLPDDTIFAPTTSENIKVDIASTSAYSNFIESLDDASTFEALGFDVNDAADVAAVENMVTKIQDVYQSLLDDGLDPEDYDSIDELLEAVDEEVEEIIAVEVVKAQNATEGNLAELVADGAGGIHWFWSEEYDGEAELERGVLNAPEQDELQIWQDGEWSTAITFDTDNADGGIFLTSEGWVQSADWNNTSGNADGSVTLTDKLVDTMQTSLTSTQIVDLEGLNIADQLGFENHAPIKDLIDNDAVFSAGAKSYALKQVVLNDNYALWYEYAEDGYCWGGEASPLAGDNCEVADLFDAGQYVQGTDSLDNLFSESAADIPNISGLVVSNVDNGIYIAELIDNEAKDVHYYYFDWQANQFSAKIASATWGTEKPAGAPADILVLSIPEAVMDEADLDADEAVLIYTELDGVVRKGNMGMAGTDISEGETLFNKQAADQIIDLIEAGVTPVEI
ncbi:hypothetical protein SIN8267_02089 [Sinobacterium norvegicum]|uniref:Lipoprotein n=1 Tax=Sinobacterium norvegicum TaxID=1641715 RepID=A0ABM9AFJ0_9GAMM|nr:hypothetical protein [Sinobacterium norvegicum]CAH0991974.1 hypothetical protein SIN8267_02089 [Sinobacterium norvegicum]